MLDLVDHSSSHGRKEPAYLLDGTLGMVSTFNFDARQRYSAELILDIASCLRMEPGARPSFVELREIIDKQISIPEREPRSVAEHRQVYMFNARAGMQPEKEEHKLHGLLGDKYPTGMVFQNLKPPKGKGLSSANPGASSSRYATA